MKSSTAIVLRNLTYVCVFTYGRLYAFNEQDHKVKTALKLVLKVREK